MMSLGSARVHLPDLQCVRNPDLKSGGRPHHGLVTTKPPKVAVVSPASRAPVPQGSSHSSFLGAGMY